MADYFVYHASLQDDSDATWNSSTLAYLDLDTCLAAVSAGDNIWVAHDHSKTYTATTVLNNAGTNVSPIKITCVNRTTGAQVTTAVEIITGAGFYFEFENAAICYGISFTSGYLKWETDSFWSYEDCVLYSNDASDADRLYYADAKLVLINTQYKQGGAAKQIRLGAGTIFEMRDGDLGSIAVNTPFRPYASGGSRLKLNGVDLSIVSTAIIATLPAQSLGIYKIELLGCKLPSAVPILASSSFTAPHEVIAHSCDNGNGYYYFEETYLEGQIKQAINCHRTSGSKYDGTNGYSVKMVSNANALDSKRPLRFKIAERWMDANPIITVDTITAGVTLQNDEFWIEIEYPNSTIKALRDIDRSSRQQVGYSGGSAPGTPANLTTSTEGWTEDLAGEVKQEVAVIISGGAAGAHTVWGCLAKPSTTVYVDRKPRIT